MRSASVSGVLAAAVVATLFPACVDSDADSTGTLSVNLVGQAPSGAVYRLRDATIVVQGPTSTKFWFTEDDPDRTSLSANVVAGDYSAVLQPGWRLERVEGPSTTTVAAEVVSPNPVQFSVAALALTTVPLQFRVLHEVIDMSQGYEIVLDVFECTAQDVCGDGVDNDCDGVVDCDDTDCAAVCDTGCGDGIVGATEQCDDGNVVSLDGCSSTCLLEPSEVEPNEDGTPQTGGSSVLGNDFAIAAADANGAFTASVQRVGHIVPAGDEDVFAFQNTAAGPATVRFDVWNSALGVGVPCGLTIDTALVIRNAAGTVLRQNDDRNGSTDRCSGTTFVLAAGQRSYLQILEFGDNAVIPNYVMTATFTAVCSNGVLEPGEQCDDGNATGGDGCSATCQLEPMAACGNGVLEAGEQCDDGNVTNGDGCSVTCQLE
jgi:cysteine-rich repeat protein